MSKIAALILAAGAGSRFGGGKQWADFHGKPMLGQVIENCRAAGCAPIQVVTGYAHDRVGEICRVFGAQASYHEHWKVGMSGSVNFGMRETLQISVWEYLLVMAGDMPWFNPAIFWTSELRDGQLADLAISDRMGANKVASISDQTIGNFAETIPKSPEEGLRRASVHGTLSVPPSGARGSKLEMYSSMISDNEPLMKAIEYPEGIGMPLLLPRSFVETHCYFVSQNNKPAYPLKKSLRSAKGIIRFPAGPHTRDVDHPGDLVP